MNSERPADLCSGPQDAGKNARQDAEKKWLIISRLFSIILNAARTDGRTIGGVAQLGERYTGSVEVMGSSPTVSIHV